MHNTSQASEQEIDAEEEREGGKRQRFREGAGDERGSKGKNIKT